MGQTINQWVVSLAFNVFMAVDMDLGDPKSPHGTQETSKMSVCDSISQPVALYVDRIMFTSVDH